MSDAKTESERDLVQLMRDEAGEMFHDHACSARAHLFMEAAQKLSDALDLIDNSERCRSSLSTELGTAARARDGLANALHNTTKELSDLRIRSDQLSAALDSAITLAQSAPNEITTKHGREDYANQLRMLVDAAIILGIRMAPKLI